MNKLAVRSAESCEAGMSNFLQVQSNSGPDTDGDRMGAVQTRASLCMFTYYFECQNGFILEAV